MRSAEPAARVSTWLGCALFAVGLWATFRTLGLPVNTYDEGLLLTHSMLVRDGAVPHRDFYSNYPPGMYLLVGALWSVTGVSPFPPRLVALSAHVAIAVLAGRLAGRVTGTTFAALPAGAVLLWLYPLGPTAYAWLVALALALASAELLLVARHGRSGLSAFACGASFGAIACFRHDLFVYLSSALALLAALVRPGLPPPRRGLAFTAGLALPIGLVFGPLVARAGLAAIAKDLLFDQVRYVNPGRALPLPWSLSLAGAAAALCLLGPLFSLSVAAVTSGERRAAGLVLGSVAVAALPQMLGRSDLFHILFAVAPAVALGLAWLQEASGRLGRPVIAVLVLLLGSGLVVLPPAAAFAAEGPVPPPWPTGPAPYHGLPADADRLAALAFVERHTRPGEPIYVGRTSHSLLLIDEVDFYFFAARAGSTRYLQFDPGTVTRDDVQAQMIRELEERGTRLLVLSECCWWPEPNASRVSGSTRLDEYIARHFGAVAEFGRYRILWRRDAVEPAA